MSTTVLPQLQTIEAELVSQAAQLEAQLASVREKLTGIRTVLPMFAKTAGAAVAEPVAAEALPPAPAVAEPVVAEAPAPIKETTKKKTAQKKAATPKKAAAQKKTPEKKAAAKAAPAKAAPAKAASAKKVDGRTATWQKYTRPGVKNESIPDAVKLILATQPENDFKIVDVMSALFTEDMPKAQYLKARNRISNVLSGGVRAGDWYKGERGTYRMKAS